MYKEERGRLRNINRMGEGVCLCIYEEIEVCAWVREKERDIKRRLCRRKHWLNNYKLVSKEQETKSLKRKEILTPDRFNDPKRQTKRKWIGLHIIFVKFKKSILFCALFTFQAHYSLWQLKLLPSPEITETNETF